MPEYPQPVYLDVCALCRPFDDQAQIRIRLETEAVQLILSYVRSGSLALIVSPVHDVEISAIDNAVERERLISTLNDIGHQGAFDMHQVRLRTKGWTEKGLGPADAAHLAFAEAAQASFVSCDDRLLRLCGRIQPNVWYGTPIAFCAEENL